MNNLTENNAIKTTYGDLAAYEGEYPVRLFNKGVRTKDQDHIGHVMKETAKEIVVFGHYGYRFDIPKAKIITFGRNVIVDLTYNEAFNYKMDRNLPLPL